MPALLPWKDEYFSAKEGTIVLGEDLAGQKITIDLNEIPHALIGGGTGSGKSFLLHLALMQMVAQKNLVFIVDFKGGLDYQADWCNNCHLSFNMESLHSILENIEQEIKYREETFKEAKARNIQEYREKTGLSFNRIIVAIDEAMEVFDKSSMTKEQKALATKVEGTLALISRQGRALGIHLWLAMQRPDMTLNGQIRSNIQGRFAGRCDKILADIILGDTTAAKVIPPNSTGTFVNQDGTVFKAYYFNE